MARFQKRRALVTGAAGGIGSALVRMLMDEGARVAAADRDISTVNATATLPATCSTEVTPMNCRRQRIAALGWCQNQSG